MGSIEKFGNSQEVSGGNPTGWENMAADVEKMKESGKGQESDDEERTEEREANDGSTTGWENMAEDVGKMRESEGGQEAGDEERAEEISDDERAEVELFRDWYLRQMQDNPAAIDDDIHTRIISGLGYNLDIPGYRPGDQNNPDAKPTEEQQARLEELYQMVINDEKDTGWENTAEDVGKMRESEKGQEAGDEERAEES